MDDSSVARGLARLPWLPDERRSRRIGGAAILLPCLVTLAVVAAAIVYSPWTIGTTGAGDPDQSSFALRAAPRPSASERAAQAFGNLQLRPPPASEPVGTTSGAIAPHWPPPGIARLASVKAVSGGTAAAPQTPTATATATAAATNVEASKSAGIECRLAKTRAAMAVCSNPILASLESEHALLYDQSWGHANSAKRALLTRARQRFMAHLDACPTDACIGGIYLAAMRELSGIMSATIAASPALPARPSFACSTATRPSEIAICSDPNLAALDQHQALLFNQSWARADTDRRSQLRAVRERLIARRDQCRTEPCTKNVYVTAMREVAEIMTRR